MFWTSRGRNLASSINLYHPTLDRQLNHREIFKRNRLSALAEWRQVAVLT